VNIRYQRFAGFLETFLLLVDVSEVGDSRISEQGYSSSQQNRADGDRSSGYGDISLDTDVDCIDRLEEQVSAVEKNDANEPQHGRATSRHPSPEHPQPLG